MNPETFKHPLIALAPMDGITDRAFRQIVRKLNPDVWLYSEFTNVDGMVHSECVRSRLDFTPQEQPYVVQLFGRNPQTFTRIIEGLADSGINGVDINMGCPSKRVVSGGNGAALIKEAELAFQIVEAAVNASSLPVSVKTRLGYQDTEGLLHFAKGLESAGAKRLTLHGRTAKMGYRGEADWSPIHQVKQALSIPVVGNGDIKSLEQGLDQSVGLDGFMVGRAAVGNPWVFWPQEQRNQVTLADKVTVMLEHFSLLREFQPEHKALVEFRKHLGGYLNGFRDAKVARRDLMQADSAKDFTQRALRLAS